eukprot:TRINITY_DN3072_c0_g2_i1.p1 TRINITY_DN3072_c0_g2~~TRINITY_DN3072_c0_g2_i1.p1  ORF type:complete len:122 (+),score=22.76 TRINITY_DN3072_c0_g2_i1:42-368(+)
MSDHSSFTPTTLVSRRDGGEPRRSAGRGRSCCAVLYPAAQTAQQGRVQSTAVSSSSCVTTSTTAAKIRELERRLADEQRARARAQQQLETTARELDLMEQVISERPQR